MAKKTPLEADEQRLQQKVSGRRAEGRDPEGIATLRTLRKRLKRVQRKRRRLEARKRHAMGKKAGADAKATAPAGA